MFRAVGDLAEDADGSRSDLCFEVGILWIYTVFNQLTINFHIFKCKIHFYEEKCIYLPYENTWVSVAWRSVTATHHT